MLIEFSVGNFLSFNQIASLNMIASPDSYLEDQSVFTENKYRLLKNAVIYGANASGKSNLLKAMAFMRRFIFESSKESQATEDIEIENFRLSTESQTQPSFFEIIFIHEQKKYRYGFEADTHQIHSEWLFFVPTRTEAKLFTRDKISIQIGSYFKEGKGLESRTRPNALFLSVVAQFNGEMANNILNWFKKLNVISGLDVRSYIDFTLKKIENKAHLKRITKLLKIADLAIQDVNINVMKTAIRDLPEKLRLEAQDISERDELTTEYFTISTQHFKYDKEKKKIATEIFNLDKNESEGTRKFFFFTGPLSDTLDNGKILFVDELDARFHPFITRLIIQLFNSVQTNPHNSQLIFATHDTKLLDNRIFRRDQIWFAEKDDYEATDLFSLAEYKESEKEDISFEYGYMLGEYGAIPFIGDIEFLTGDDDE
ncbi:MAG: ATP-binding protein [Proteobacteria bacterium]|nr:ATP-binding protein [Pseudomonadota bacterium]